MTRQSLAPLTSFRFLAVMFVFLWHIGFLREYQTGYVGVSFFYTLSGFILTYNYVHRFRHPSSEARRQFYWARFARIYPVYALAFLWSIPLTPIHAYGNLATWIGVGLANLALIQSYIPYLAIAFSFDGVAWSLSDEATFYAIFPWLMQWWNTLGRHWHARHVVLGMAILWGSLVALLIPYHSSWQSWIAYIFPGTRLVDFFIGMGAALVFDRIAWNRPGTHLPWTTLEVAGLLLVVGTIAIGPYTEQSLRFSALYLPGWAILLWIFAHQKGVMSRVFSHAALVRLGNWSFAFYMIHRLVMRTLQKFNLYHYHGPLWQDGLVLMTAVALSALIYYHYEEPVRRKLRHKFSVYPGSYAQTIAQHATSAR
ncbi:acyltransferase [Sulfobacillus sp. hq2]|uniref:acyltransferase family protein n=1 Tax=Sulfobacillus sp. hq2 TaxID=2039167 RepID=UPI002101C106|nr:acyltransferase [Sulfobacillus sp. hq2]